MAEQVAFGEGFVFAAAAASSEAVLHQEGEQAASKEAHPVAAFGLKAFQPGLGGRVQLLQLAADAAEGEFLGVGGGAGRGWGRRRIGRGNGVRAGRAVEQLLDVLAPKAAVAAGGAIDRQAAAVGPLAQGSLVDVQGAADFAEGHPAGFVLGDGGGQNL